MKINIKSIPTFLILISIIYFLPGLFSPRDFWIEDEARYAEIVREMMIEHEWFIPHLNGHYYPDKPPLYFWLVIFTSIVFGTISPFTFLLVTFLSTLGCIVAVYYLGKYLFDSMSGFLAAIVLTSTFLFIISAQIARMDMLFALFITLSIFSFYHAFLNKKRSYYIIFYFLCFLAILSKGPLGFIFAFLPAVLFLSYKKEYKELKEFILNKGFILLLLLLVGWVLLLILGGHYDYIKIIIVEQLVGRAVNSFIHKEPFYFYILVFPLVFYPWIPILPRALFHLHSTQKDAFALLLIWFISGFVVISMISGKLFIYLLPLFPPMALVIGKFFGDILQKYDQYKYDLLIEGIVSCVLFGLALILFPIALKLYFPKGMNFFLPLLVLLLPLFPLALVFTLKRNVKFHIALTFIGMFIFSFFSFGYSGTRISKHFSSRVLSEKITELSRKGFMTTSFNVTRGIFNFYADSYIKELTFDELQTMLSSNTKLQCVLKEHELKRLNKPISKKVKVVGEYALAFEKYFLITN